MTKQPKTDQALRAVNQLVCANCGKPKADHYGLRNKCPMSLKVKPSSRFKPVER